MEKPLHSEEEAEVSCGGTRRYENQGLLRFSLDRLWTGFGNAPYFPPLPPRPS